MASPHDLYMLYMIFQNAYTEALTFSSQSLHLLKEHCFILHKITCSKSCIADHSATVLTQVRTSNSSASTPQKKQEEAKANIGRKCPHSNWLTKWGFSVQQTSIPLHFHAALKYICKHVKVYGKTDKSLAASACWERIIYTPTSVPVKGLNVFIYFHYAPCLLWEWNLTSCLEKYWFAMWRSASF